MCIACSPLTSIVAVMLGDKTVKIWGSMRGDLRATFKGHGEGVRSVAISHDGALVVSGSGEQSDRWYSA